jgi:hypothetical protein
MIQPNGKRLGQRANRRAGKGSRIGDRYISEMALLTIDNARQVYPDLPRDFYNH